MGYKENEPSVILVDYIGGGKRGGTYEEPPSADASERGSQPGSKGSDGSMGGLKPMRVAWRYSKKVWAPLWKK